MNTIFNRRKRRIAELSKVINTKTRKIDCLEEDFERCSRSKDRILTRLHRLKWRYAVFGAGKRFVLGGKGSGKTHFIKHILIPNMKRPYFIIDLLGCYKDYGVHGVDRFDYETVFRNSNSDKGQAFVQLMSHLRAISPTTTIILDDSLLIKAYFGNHNARKIIQLIQQRYYIVTGTSYRLMSEFTNGVAHYDIDHLFLFDSVSISSEDIKRKSSLQSEDRITFVERTDEQIGFIKSVGIKNTYKSEQKIEH